MEMFTSFKKVMADPEITTAGKSVFLNLLSRMDKKGYCYPAVNTMEDETGYCERTIQRQTNKLAEKGYIVKAELFTFSISKYENNKIRKVSTCIFYYACGSGSFYLLFG